MVIEVQEHSTWSFPPPPPSPYKPFKSNQAALIVALYAFSIWHSIPDATRDVVNVSKIGSKRERQNNYLELLSFFFSFLHIISPIWEGFVRTPTPGMRRRSHRGRPLGTAMRRTLSQLHIVWEDIITIIIHQGHWIHEQTVIQDIQEERQYLWEQGEPTPSHFNQIFQHSVTQWYHYDNNSSDRNNKSMNSNTDNNNNNKEKNCNNNKKKNKSQE